MRDPIEFSDNSKEVEKALKAQIPRVYKYTRRAFVRIGEHWVNDVKESFTGYSGWKNRTPEGPGGRLQNRSGALRSSVGFHLRGSRLHNLTLVMGVGKKGTDTAKYAGVQEEGKVISAVNKQYMTIPLPNALTPGGKLKNNAKLHAYGSRGYETGRGRTFIDHHVIFAQKTPRSRPVALYKLTKSVRIPARLNAGRRVKLRLEAAFPRWNEAVNLILLRPFGGGTG